MLQLLALGNTLHSVIVAVSQEFGCSQNTVYKDYQNMEHWGKKFRQDKQTSFVLHARLELLNRTATDNMLNAKTSPDKVRAANLVLKITQEQKRIENEVESQKSSPKGFAGNISLRMPFEYDPLIKQAYLDEEAKQRAQRAEKDAAAKAESNTGH
jgi:biotin operon repressor